MVAEASTVGGEKLGTQRDATKEEKQAKGAWHERERNPYVYFARLTD